MADAPQTAERDLAQADQRIDRRFDEQQREIVRQGQQLTAIEKLIEQNNEHHKDRMARYEAAQEKMFERLEARIEQNATKITESNEHVIRLDILIDQHDERMDSQAEIQRELRATIEQNAKRITESNERTTRLNTLIDQHDERMGSQAEIQRDLRATIEQNAKRITESNKQVIRLDTLIDQHDERMSRLSEIQRELRATMQSNFNWIIGVVLGGVFLILGTLVTGFFALPN